MSLNLPLVLQLIGTVLMLVGVAFGIQNIRQYQAGRKRESAILLLNSFQTSDFVRGLLVIFDLPPHVSKKEVDALASEQFLAVYMVLGTWERLGLLVYRREIDLTLVEDAYGGPIIQSWQKLEHYLQEFRAYVQRDSALEWFQWLAERLLECEAKQPALPAYLAHRDWKPKP